MRRNASIVTMLVLVGSLASACLPLTPMPSNQVSEAYIQTAVASTLAAERALAAGAALSADYTPGSTPSPEGTPGTPDGEPTPEAEETGEAGEPEPTSENPWMLQSWCADHVGCVYYDVSNRTDSWLQIELKESETGVTGFFTVRSKTIGRITLIPGHYQVKYTWWCDGEIGTLTENKAVGSWVDVFKCPQGYYQRLNKE